MDIHGKFVGEITDYGAAFNLKPCCFRQNNARIIFVKEKNL
jgi:hypothetical protein